MARRRLCLDLDSTLAATSATALDLINGPDHDYTYDDIETWTWGMDEFGKYRYLSAMWHAWTIRPLDVPQMEPDVADAVRRLADRYEVHVVTAHPDHPGIDDGKKEWLDHHDIPHDEYRSVDPKTSKAALDYDAYIDDKPALAGEIADQNPDATVYVRDQPYNRDVDAPHERVASIHEVADAEGL